MKIRPSAPRLLGTARLVAAFVWTVPVAALAQTPGTLQGRIVNSTSGRPLGFALVTVVDQEGREVGSDLTNTAGYYALRLPEGSYQVSVSASGYGTQQTGSVSLPPGGQLVGINFSLARQSFELSPVVMSVGRTVEKAIGAPAHVETVSQAEIRSAPGLTLVDHLRGLPGADIITEGLQSTNPVLRGFNNVFSGGLHVIVDHRVAGLPSLRANVMSFIPTTEVDVDRMEVVLGPGAALYGPNTAHGVLHVVTRSPLLEPGGASVIVTGGERGLVSGTFRASGIVGQRLGVKLSGELFQGVEWEYADPVELTEQAKFAADLDFWRERLMRAAGIDAEEADRQIARIGFRDPDVRRMSAELRADWAVTDDATAAFSAGLTNAASQIELTPLGAAQARDWKYMFAQARLNWHRLFGQAYLNQNDAGESFLLRNGAPIRDASRLVSVQVQHSADLGLRQRFTYGVDYFFTQPRTDGTISGIYEDRDETTELGGYVQSETRISSVLDLVLAGRVDHHSLLPDPILSPRAALVFKPREEQAIRLTYNRAFTVPTALNQFLDLATPIPNEAAAALGYSIRVQGSGIDGFHFQTGAGDYLMRSPFTPTELGGPTELLAAEAAASFWTAAVHTAAEMASTAGEPLDPELVAFLAGLEPTPADVRSYYRDTVTGAEGFVSALEVRDVEPLRESIHSTVELGYQGLIGDQMVIALDVWHSRRRDMVTPVTVWTPLVSLSGSDVAAYLVPRLVGRGMLQEDAEELAARLATGIGAVPVGVISTPEMHATGPQLLATFTNVEDEIRFWGVDLSTRVLLSQLWSLAVAASFVSRDAFRTNRGPIFALNAPATKGSSSLEYRGTNRGLSGGLRVRYSSGYPASSGVFEGLACLEDAHGSESPCVASYTLLDASFSSVIPWISDASVRVSVQNFLDEDYRSFPGVPGVGRMAVIGIRYDF
jgi:iron complex outermembrane receptor protein